MNDRISEMAFQSILKLIIGVSAYADPTLRNSDSESSAFGTIAEVSPTGVQWSGLTLGEQPN